MRKTLIILFSLSLLGCAELNALRSSIGAYGEQASDRALQDVIWSMCNAMPVGAVKRKFNTRGRLELYSKLCGDEHILDE